MVWRNRPDDSSWWQLELRRSPFTLIYWWWMRWLRVRQCKPLLWGKGVFGEDRLDKSLAARAPPLTVNDLSSPPCSQKLQRTAELLGLGDAALSKRSSISQPFKSRHLTSCSDMKQSRAERSLHWFLCQPAQEPMHWNKTCWINVNETRKLVAHIKIVLTENDLFLFNILDSYLLKLW